MGSDVIEQRLGGEPYLAEEALGSAARKIEDGVRLLANFRRVANDRDHRRVLDVEERARGLLRQVARHRLVDEMDHLRGDRRFP